MQLFFDFSFVKFSLSIFLSLLTHSLARVDEDEGEFIFTFLYFTFLFFPFLCVLKFRFMGLNVVLIGINANSIFGVIVISCHFRITPFPICKDI